MASSREFVRFFFGDDFMLLCFTVGRSQFNMLGDGVGGESVLSKGGWGAGGVYF